MIPSILRRDGFIVLTVLKRLASLVLIWSPAVARFWGLGGRFQTPKQSPGFYAGTPFFNLTNFFEIFELFLCSFELFFLLI